jgi:hypothetical protein
LTNLNLLRYFISADEDLPPSYVKKCEKFLKEISLKQQAASRKLQASSAMKRTQLKGRIKT